ncbi:MAG TPA: hypothetical protein VFX88_20305, partial [Actinomycetota bacterium]|nr:hypothetical protein [Actinomycetota bacterium]
VVIGVDTHKETHTAAVVAATTGAVLAQATVTATPVGYRQLLAWPTARVAAGSGRSRAPVATAPA